MAVAVKFVDKEPYDVIAKDYAIIVPFGINTILLPDAAEVIGRVLVIKVTSNDDKGIVVRSASGKDNIDGAGSLSMGNVNQGDLNCVTLLAARGGDWVIIGKCSR
jgi:hypothetical protein